MSSTLTWITYDPNADTKKGPRRRRRPHMKSRGGCVQCKWRRIKCDEERPSCSQCSRRSGLTCRYAEQQWKSYSPLLPPSVSRGVSEVDSFASLINTISASQGWQMVATNETYVELFSRFQKQTVTTLSSPTWQQIMVAKGVGLIQDYPFFVHAIVAFTACHLSCVGRQELAPIGMHHAQQAIHFYAKRLHQVTERKEMDAMIATSFILTALFYLSHDRMNLTETWITDSKDLAAKPHWATILSGPSTLLARSIAFPGSDRVSLWLPFTDNSQQCVRQAAAQSGPGHSLVSLLYELCSTNHTQVNQSSHAGTPDKNVYWPAISVLAPALEANFDSECMTIKSCTDVATYVLVMTFPSRLDPSLIGLLAKRDSIALLIVGFWLALLAKLQHCQWWCLQRALTEGQAICSYLKGLLFPDRKLKAAISLLDNVLPDPSSMASIAQS